MDNQKETTRGEVLLPAQLDDDVLRYVMECAGLKNPDGARLVKAIHHFMHEALATKPELQPRADDFARIVRASDGRQVLFYKEVDAEEGNTLHCMVQFDDYQGTYSMRGMPDTPFATALGRVNVGMADSAVRQLAGFFTPEESA